MHKPVLKKGNKIRSSKKKILETGKKGIITNSADSRKLNPKPTAEKAGNQPSLHHKIFEKLRNEVGAKIKKIC